MTQAQFDQQLNLLGAHIQHGPANDRIYLISIGNAEPGPLLDALNALALEHGYGKIIAKLPEHKAGLFLAYGFSEEARIPIFIKARTPYFSPITRTKPDNFAPCRSWISCCSTPELTSSPNSIRLPRWPPVRKRTCHRWPSFMPKCFPATPSPLKIRNFYGKTWPVMSTTLGSAGKGN